VAIVVGTALLLPLVGLSSGNQPNDVAPLGEGDVVDAPSDLGEHVVPYLAVIVSRVRHGKLGPALERFEDVVEVDSMLADIAAILGIVPSELHMYIKEQT
jgi:hypothetical protein